MYYGPLIGIHRQRPSIRELQAALTDELTKWYQKIRGSSSPFSSFVRSGPPSLAASAPGSIALQGGERVIDLIAAAGGLATSRFSGSTEELADLSGAVLIRQGKVLPVDFNALVKQGDLQQNIRVHPGDHCYIPSSLVP